MTSRKALVILATLTILFLMAGCVKKPAVEFQVEQENVDKGKNLTPLVNKIKQDAEEAIRIWIEEPDRIEEAFTENMMNMWREARRLDEEEGVKRVRVHENQEIKVTYADEGIRPQITYRFFDKSYFVDAKTGKPVTKPYNKERIITIYMVKEGDKYKIDGMIGSEDALR